MSTDVKNAIDERLAAALDASNYRVTLHLQKQNSKLKLQSDLVYSFNGGIFVANSDLISFISALINMGKQSGIVLDKNDNPIEITDLKEFLEEIVSLYYEAMNEHLKDFNKIKLSRTSAKSIEW